MSHTPDRRVLATLPTFAAPMALARPGQGHHGDHGDHGHGSAARAARSVQGNQAGRGDHPAHGVQAGQAGHPEHEVHAMRTEEAVLGVPIPSRETAVTVDRFMAALARGDSDAVRAESVPAAMVCASGGSGEYFDCPAGHDAAFPKSTHHQPRHRVARASADSAWAVYESGVHTEKAGRIPSAFSTGTMVTRRSGPRWRLVHIHWSGHEKQYLSHSPAPASAGAGHPPPEVSHGQQRSRPQARATPLPSFR